MDIIMKKLEWQEILRKANISETEFEEFRKNRYVFRSLQTAKANLANVTKEKNDAIGELNQVNDRLDGCILIPKAREITLQIAMKIVDSQLKVFQIGGINNLRTTFKSQ
jgi:hypothetical protein